MWNSTPAIGLFALILVIVVVAWLIRTVANRGQQIERLMRRVDELEDRMTSDLPDGSVRVSEESLAKEPSDSAEQRVSRDALAGWTSHVSQLLAEKAEPIDPTEMAVVAIHRHIGEPIRPSDLANELEISLRTLERVLTRDLDCSPSDLILTVKMREARRMLESGRFRILEIAHRLAFSDSAHFSRRYRSFYRCPPSQHLVVYRGFDDCTGASK